jgi:hypothetical protein
MRIKIINNRLLAITRPGVSCFKPDEYVEKILIPISKISKVTLVRNYLEVVLDSRENFGYFPERPEDSHALFKQLHEIMGAAAEELK